MDTTQTPNEFSPEAIAIVERVQVILDEKKADILKSVDARNAAATSATESALRGAIASVASSGASGVDLRGLVRDEVKPTVEQIQRLSNDVDHMMRNIGSGAGGSFSGDLRALARDEKFVVGLGKAGQLLVDQPSFLTRAGVTKGFEPAAVGFSPAQASAALSAALPAFVEAAKAEHGPAGEMAAISAAGWLDMGYRHAHAAGLVQAPQSGLQRWAAITLGIAGTAAVAGGITLGVMAATKTGLFREPPQG